MKIDRRSLLAMGGSALAASALLPRAAFAQTTPINYWHHFTSQSEFAGLDAVQKLFAAAHAEIALTQENIPNTEFMAKVTAAVVADSRPDTIMIAAERLADMVSMGAVLDLTDRVSGWELRPDFPDDRFTGITVDGKVYGVPAFTFVDWMFYRKDWFEEAGIAPPTTYDEFLAAAKAMTDPAKNRYGFSMRGAAGGQKWLIDVMESFGAPLLTDGVPGLDRDKAIAALDWYAGLVTREKVVPASAASDGFQQIFTAFKTGQTAMLWGHTGNLMEVASALEPGVEFGTVPVPAGPANRVARLAYLYNGMMKDDNADASWEWIKFWGEADTAIAFLEQTGYFPANIKVAQDERITSNPIYAAAVETLSYGSLPPSFVGAAGWGESVALPAFQRILIGEATPEQAVDEMIAGLAEATS